MAQSDSRITLSGKQTGRFYDIMIEQETRLTNDGNSVLKGKKAKYTVGRNEL
jgi:hypothetical protein